MGIQIVTRHMCLSVELKQRVTELCEEVMQRFPDVLRIRVVLDDINGPDKAGVDKRCHLMVRGRNHLRIDVNEFQDDVWPSIDGAYRQLLVKLARYKRQESEAKLTIADASMPVSEYVSMCLDPVVGPWPDYRVYDDEG